MLSWTLRADWWSAEAGENRREGEGEGVGQALTSVTYEADVLVCCAQWGD